MEMFTRDEQGNLLVRWPSRAKNSPTWDKPSRDDNGWIHFSLPSSFESVRTATAQEFQRAALLGEPYANDHSAVAVAARIRFQLATPVATATLYCTLCGNEEIESSTTDHIGPLCRPFIEGPLQRAYDAWLYVREAWGECCGGLSSDISFGRDLAARIKGFNSGTHLRLHPKFYGESNYYLTNNLTDQPIMWVECGIRFGQDGATCYWIFDNDTIGLSQSEPLDGGPVSYEQDGEPFLNELAKILSSAAEQAYMSDHLICEVCTGHYYSPNGPCCEGGAGEDEDGEV